jgi:hypothetical protein
MGNDGAVKIRFAFSTDSPKVTMSQEALAMFATLNHLG